MLKLTEKELRADLLKMGVNRIVALCPRFFDLVDSGINYNFSPCGGNADSHFIYTRNGSYLCFVIYKDMAFISSEDSGGLSLGKPVLEYSQAKELVLECGNSALAGILC